MLTVDGANSYMTLVPFGPIFSIPRRSLLSVETRNVTGAAWMVLSRQIFMPLPEKTANEGFSEGVIFSRVNPSSSRKNATPLSNDGEETTR